jgi:tRNA threonylcarbamoyladenosine biosynthesis protein TsaB
MALLLNIDTANEQAGVCLSMDETVLATEQNGGQKNHASFIQPAIQKVMQTAGYALNAIDAVSVTGGPGSYTGLRVGLSTAKGLCYALNKPLIMINTLEVMAYASIIKTGHPTEAEGTVLFCPMIDARRMEVFTALYNSHLGEIIRPSAMVLDESSFQSELFAQKIIFSGSGSTKAKIIQHPNAFFANVENTVETLSVLALMAYKASKFSPLAYSEPFYLKEFYKKA